MSRLHTSRARLLAAALPLLAVVSTLIPPQGRLAAQTRKGKVIYMTEGEVARKTVRIEDLRKGVYFLTDTLCDGRKTGTPGAGRAAQWIRERFEAQGLVPCGEGFDHPFKTPGGDTGHNIVGMLRGSQKRVWTRYVLVMASYDGLGTKDGILYPGADYNASGVVAMCSVGDMFAKMISIGKGYGANVLFVGMDGRHTGLSGSLAFWDELKAGLVKDPYREEPISVEDIALVVNIDQVGATLSPIRKDRPDYLIMLGGDGYRNSAATSVNNIDAIRLDLGLDYYGSRDFTRLMYRTFGDQKVFVDNDRPAVVFTSGITMRNNKPDDTPDTVDLQILRKRIWLMFHFIERSM